MPVTLALKRLKQEDHKFNASLGYIVRPYLKKLQVEKSISDLGFRENFIM
jgi:hypothetical protein